ncbi:MAG: hypothetical protein AB8B71_01300 [Paracoccaceae bacterium]
MASVDILFWVLAGGAAIVVALLALWADARSAGWIILQFFFAIALPILVALVALVWLAWPVLSTLDSRVGQALVAGFVIAVGWLTTAIFAQLEHKRARDEKLRDYHKAIYAEIRNSIDVFWDGGAARSQAARLVRAMRKDPTFVPLLPYEVHDRIYSSIVKEIEALPRVTIDLIVAYYSTISTMSALADDMRSDRYISGDFDQTRRIRLYLDFFSTRNRAYLLGQGTLSVIDAYSQGGVTAAQTKLAALNNPDAGPTGRQREKV